MPAIFISHSSRDQTHADDVTRALKDAGFEEVFLDFDKDTGIGAGADWEKTLYEKLARCHALILVLTPHWLASTWCRIELAQARAMGKVILPIVCAPLGDKFVLPEVQAVDVIDWKSDGLERIEKRLHAITSELARGFNFDPHRPPYPGIHAFEAEDAAIYFGRDQEVRSVIERLDARRSQGGSKLIVIIGASGSGKSSLLRAGVLPQMGRRKRDWVVLPALRPEKAPMEVLAKAIAEKVGKPQEWRTWEERLLSPVAIDHIAELLKDFRIGEAKSATVLLPIDQFEEAFTVATPAQREGFLQLIATALDPARDLPLMVLATGRSDVLEGLIETGALAQLMETFPLPPMPLDRVPRLVEGPAAVASINVDKGLAERIARDVETPEALPLLAHALWLLHRRGAADKRLSHSEYEALGDPEHKLNPIQNSVRLVADQALAGIKPSERELAALRDAFVPHLVRVQLSDGKRVRQPARMSELPPEAMRLVRSLIESRLLTTRAAQADGEAATASDTLVEVTHESLFKAWPTLERWLDEEQSFLVDIERIRGAHEVWAQAPDERRSEALLQGLLLSRARDWLLRYPQRFSGRDLDETRHFIVASADAEDAQRAAAEAQRERTRRIERMLFRGAVAAAILLAIGGAAVTYQYFAAEQARREAVAQRQRAEQQRNRALLSESRFLANQASQIADTDPTNAMLVALSGLPDAAAGVERPYAAEPEAALRAAAFARRERFVLAGIESKVSDIVFSPDGARLATASEDKTVHLWDARTGKIIAVLRGHDESVGRVMFSPDGSRLISSSSDTTRLWDAASGKQVAVVAGHIGGFSSAVFSPDGKRFATVHHKDKTVRIWDAANGGQVAQLIGHEGEAVSVAFSPDGSLLASGADDRTVRIWDTTGWTQRSVLRGHEARIWNVNFSGDGARLISASNDETVRIWDVAAATEQSLLKFERDAGSVIPRFVFDGRFNADGSRIMTRTLDGTQLWDAATGQQLEAFPKTGTTFWRGAFTPDGKRLVIGSNDKIIRLFDAATGKQLSTLSGHAGAIIHVALSPDGANVATSSEDLTVRIWDLAAPSEFTRLRGLAKLWDADFDAANDRLVTASSPDKENVVQLWDVRSGQELRSLTGDLVASVSFAPDGSRFLTGSADRSVKLWDTASGERVGVLRGHSSTVFGTIFNRDGSRMLAWSNDGKARLWDVRKSAELAVIDLPKRRVSGLQFSAGGSRIVGLSSDAETKADGTAHMWDGVTGRHVAMLGEASAVARSIAASGDDKLVATVEGSVARIWDAVSGVHIRNLSGHTADITAVRFSPDFTRLATLSADKTTRIWEVGSGRLLYTFDERFDPFTAAFNPAGTRLVTGSVVGAVRFWNLETGEALAAFDPGDAYIPTMSFTGDGARVILSLRERAFLLETDTAFVLADAKFGNVLTVSKPSSDGRAMLLLDRPEGPGMTPLHLTTQTVLDHVKATVPRCLTRQERAGLLLDPMPPDWCIEREKWPFHSEAWKQWLADKRSGRQSPMPER